jgi:hypothetical protein
VIAHHSLNAPASGPSRSHSLRPEGNARPTILIELALHVDGRRLVPSEVLSQLVSCYIALTAARPPQTAGGASPGAGDTPAERPDDLPLSGDPGSLDRAGTGDGSAASAALSTAGEAEAGDGERSVEHAAADPHGLLHIVAPRARGGATASPSAPSPPPKERDARGRWVKEKGAR